MQRGFNYIAKLAFVFLILSVPTFAQAACSENGYTIVFVNGVFDTEQQAKDNTDALQFRLGNSFNGQPIIYKVGYNQTHIAGLGDLAEVAFPALDQFDLDTILRQIHDEVHTRKLLIVGHSQGASYANKIYDYLVAHGEPKDAVAIYAVATPEPILSYKGNYLNFEGDATIYGLLASKLIHPPPFNVSEAFYWTSTTTDGGSYQGHTFINEYLASFGDRITSEIKSQLFILRPTYASETLDECFSAPEDTTAHKMAAVGIGISDFYATSVVGVVQQGYGEVVVAVGVGDKVLSAVGGFFGTVASAFTPKPPDPNTDRAANDTGVALLNALNLTSLDVQTADQLQRDAQKKKNNNSMGGAAILAFMQDDQAPGEVLGSSTPQNAADSTAGQAATTTPILFPTAPDAMPGEVVHYNAPTFGGLAAAQQDASSSPPDPPPADVLVPPTITFSNWHASTNVFFCSGLLRYVDVSWGAVAGATYYEIRTDDALPTSYNELSTTTATTWPNLVLATTNDRIDPITVTVTAYDAAGNNAASTARVDQALADQTPPHLLFESLSPQLFATGTPVTTTIKIPFSEPLATSTIVHSALILSSFTQGVQVDTNLSLSADGTVVIFTPLQPLNYASSYGVSIDCTISDIYGNRLPNQIGVGSQNSPYFTTEVQ